MTGPAELADRPLGWARRRLAQRGQAGLTLMEILLAMGIAAILMAPLGTWAYGTLKSGIISQDELGRANATGLLNIYFLRDVASARAFVVTADGVTDCTGVPASAAGTPIVRLVQSGDVTTSVVYTVGNGPDPVPMFRHVCGPDGALTASTRVLAKVQASSVSAFCSDAAGGPVGGCNDPAAVRVTMTLRQLSKAGPKAPITVSGTRRTTGTGTGFAQSNPPVPTFKIDPGPRGYATTVFTATSTATDPDSGDTLALQWTLPPHAELISGGGTGPSVTFRLPSSGEVVLTVSDGSNSASSAVPVWIVNRPPVFNPDWECRLVSERTYQLIGTAVDPEVGPVGVQWFDPAGGEIAGGTWNAPDGLTGSIDLTMRASDGTDAVEQQVPCYVATPVDAGIAITPTPTPGGVVNAVAPGGSRDVTFAAVDPGTASITWALYRKGAATPINSSASPGANWTLTFLASEAGEYEVVRITDGTPGPRVGFRINVEPAVSLTSAEQTGVVPARIVTFNSTATDTAPGSVVATTWDFGDGTVVEAPAGTVTHTYTAPGDYTVRFSATDNDGAVGAATLVINVPAAPGAGPGAPAPAAPIGGGG